MFNDDEAFVPLGDQKAGKMPWVPKTKSSKDVRSLPRLHIFASELTFLTLAITHCDIDKCVVVYAGAAGGAHIPTLASLYPRTQFYLYDPRHVDFDATDQITIFRAKFTDHLAHYWRMSGERVIFISDIRTLGLEGLEYEHAIAKDMETQARWVAILRPVWYKLTFRIPYPIMSRGEKYPYLGGRLLFQPFTKPLSTQLSLVGNVASSLARVNYDTTEIEQLLLFHNKIVRPDKSRYYNVFTFDDKPYSDAFFDRGYDTTFLLYVIDNYLRSPKSAIPGSRKFNEAEALHCIKTLINKIGRDVWPA